jgi:hypothetical protein
MNVPMMLIVAFATLWMGRVSGISSPEALALLGNNNGLASAVLVRQGDGQPLRRQLQQHEDFCDLVYDLLIDLNAGASCECKRRAATLTCVGPSQCDKEFTGCGGGGEICGFVTRIYGFVIEGDMVTLNTQRSVGQFTSGEGSLLGQETTQEVGTGQCDVFMTTLDGFRYQCNDCSTNCPGDDEFNVDCSNIQADSTTRGQCVSLSTTTADLGLLNNFCVEGPIVPTTLPVPVSSAAGLWHQNVLLATTAALTCSLLMMI